MQISGHRHARVFDRYNIVDEGDVANAAEKLDNYSRTAQGQRAAKLERVK